MTVDNYLTYCYSLFGRKASVIIDNNFNFDGKYSAIIKYLQVDISHDIIECPINMFEAATSKKELGYTKLLYPILRRERENLMLKADKFSKILDIAKSSVEQMIVVKDTIYYGNNSIIYDADHNILLMHTITLDTSKNDTEKIISYNCRISPKVFSFEKKNNFLESRIIKNIIPACAIRYVPNYRKTKRIKIIIDDMSQFFREIKAPDINKDINFNDILTNHINDFNIS